MATALFLVLAGCGADADVSAPDPPTPAPGTSAPPTSPTATPTPSRTPTSKAPKARPGTVPPAWLGTRVLPHEPGGIGRIEPTPKVLRNRRFTLPDTLPPPADGGFHAHVQRAPGSVIARSTWAKGCPVSRRDLSYVTVSFWGFDHRPHTGELLVNHTVADDLVQVFRTLFAERFPIEQMSITTKAERDAEPTGDGNDTGAFNCRPVTGGSSYSQHAYGLAIDVNPFQNPYSKGDVVLPELASAYLDRSWKRPGMILPGDQVIRAFASVGWEWGGAWHSLKDRQHFSLNDR